ncbi:uncharacterized protein BDR25DRAFT_353102 [Lindgomyces ingoldianus]|uniref:Uncharacterized protein n=1 Tax=Lindgomyces ingoldianus TaxID=673940 RepID=A0ACB6R1S5_9PLEO|nr:uncharacterized protein BDR25DRAFT_353102 [Lindgomyces ingoldianus]KAF2472778.1 hypothetical protein BDR25DRAFT_353102 [Lindgomyces ingoldianus]
MKSWKASLALPLGFALFFNITTATQSTYIQAVSSPVYHHLGFITDIYLCDCISNDYHSVDKNPGNGLCHGQYCNPDWIAGGSDFKYISYGTKCRFHVTKSVSKQYSKRVWPDAEKGETVGYGSCPGVKGIPGIKQVEDHAGFCLSLIPFSISCEDRVVTHLQYVLNTGEFELRVVFPLFSILKFLKNVVRRTVKAVALKGFVFVKREEWDLNIGIGRYRVVTSVDSDEVVVIVIQMPEAAAHHSTAPYAALPNCNDSHESLHLGSPELPEGFRIGPDPNLAPTPAVTPIPSCI